MAVFPGKISGLVGNKFVVVVGVPALVVAVTCLFQKSSGFAAATPRETVVNSNFISNILPVVISAEPVYRDRQLSSYMSRYLSGELTSSSRQAAPSTMPSTNRNHTSPVRTQMVKCMVSTAECLRECIRLIGCRSPHLALHLNGGRKPFRTVARDAANSSWLSRHGRGSHLLASRA